jgi:hypothetical protein
MARAQTPWAEVIQRRRDWDNQDPEGSMERWTAHDRAWVGRLEDVLETAKTALTGPSDADPRESLIDVIAVCSALIDQMGDDQAAGATQTPRVLNPAAVGRAHRTPVVQLSPGAAELIRIPPP